MKNESAIIYREFYDVPHVFLTQYGGRQFLFESLFDDALDAYSPTYKVYTMPPVSEEQLLGSWAHLTDLAQECLGEVPVKDVVFDPTRRRAVRTNVLEALPASEKAAAA